MRGKAGHPAPERELARLSALWFGLFGGFAAWTVQTLVNLPVAAHGCFPRLEPLASPVTEVRGAASAVSVVAVLVSAAAVLVAWRTWSRTRQEHQQSSGSGSTEGQWAALLETGEGRTRFMALAGVLTSGAFLLITIATACAIFLVQPCAG
jgi:hypothetical protein